MMKKIFTTTVFFSLLLLTYTSQSQVSGYMGKRNVLKLGLFMKSSFVMPNSNGESGYFSFNDRYSIAFERVLTRNKSIEIHATSFETFYKMFEYTDNESAPMYKMSCKAYGGDFLFYRSSHIAPLGAYTSVGFDVIVTTADVDMTEFKERYDYSSYGFEDENQNWFTYSNNNISTTHLGLNMKSGAKQIFFNCLSVDFNFHVGVIFSENIVGESSFDNIGQGVFQERFDDYIKGRIGNRLWGHYLWGVNCSVGYLF
jgi:hypothetical protein